MLNLELAFSFDREMITFISDYDYCQIDMLTLHVWHIIYVLLNHMLPLTGYSTA